MDTPPRCAGVIVISLWVQDHSRIRRTVDRDRADMISARVIRRRLPDLKNRTLEIAPGARIPPSRDLQHRDEETRDAASPDAYSRNVRTRSRRAWVIVAVVVLASIAAAYVTMDFVLTAISCGSASLCGGG